MVCVCVCMKAHVVLVRVCLQMPHDEFRKAITSLDVTKLQPNFVSQVRPDRSLPSARFSLAFPLFLALARGCASSGPTCTTHIQEGKHARFFFSFSFSLWLRSAHHFAQSLTLEGALGVQLLRLLPSDQEVASLQSYTGPKEDLGVC